MSVLPEMDTPFFAEHTSRAFDLSNVSVCIGYARGESVKGKFLDSLLLTKDALHEHGIPHNEFCVEGCSIVDHARNMVLDGFLNSKHNRLFMLDSDQEWVGRDFITLLALSTCMDIVLAAYPAKQEPYVYFMSQPEGEMKMNEYGCLPVSGLGLGFCCVTRPVIERLAEKAEKYAFGTQKRPIARVFKQDVVNGVFKGEDIGFFEDAKALGYQAWLNPNVDIGHLGTKNYKTSIWNALRKHHAEEVDRPTVSARRA